MIKAVKHGKEHHSVKCKTCECEFEFDLVDFFDKDDNVYIETVHCPECGEGIGEDILINKRCVKNQF